MGDCSENENKRTILVAGAGPVGLLTALRLAQVGLKVVVMEKAGVFDDRPRAIGYVAGALLALRSAGILEKVKEAGFRTAGPFWRRPLVDDGKGGKKYGAVLAAMSLPGEPHDPDDLATFVGLPQSKLSRLIYKEALATGLVDVHFNTALIDIEDKGDSVRAIVQSDAPGSPNSYEGAFLIGADGARSSTRKFLGIPFKGHSWPDRLLAVDVRFESPDMEDDLATHFSIHSVHWGLITPLESPNPGKKTLHRCAIATDAEDPRSDEELSSEGSVLELLAKMIPGPRPINVEIVNASTFRMHQLVAATFRKGRCILAGDAAHLNNPMGAMGLSTGLLDSEALSDTLDMIMNEGKPMELLDIYADERRKVFQLFVNPVSSANKLRLSSDPDFAKDDWLIRALNQSDHDTIADYGS